MIMCCCAWCGGTGDMRPPGWTLLGAADPFSRPPRRAVIRVDPSCPSAQEGQHTR